MSVILHVVVDVVVAVVVDMDGGSATEDVGGGGSVGVGTGMGGGSTGTEADAGRGNGTGTGTGIAGSMETRLGQVLLWMSNVVVIVGVIVQTRFVSINVACSVPEPSGWVAEANTVWTTVVAIVCSIVETTVCTISGVVGCLLVETMVCLTVDAEVGLVLATVVCSVVKCLLSDVESPTNVVVDGTPAKDNVKCCTEATVGRSTA